MEQVEKRYSVGCGIPAPLSSGGCARRKRGDAVKNCAVYFLDIELGTDENGIDAAYCIHEADPDGCIVYVSAYQQYAMDCLHSHAFDFLSKPVNSRELTACMKAVLKEMEKVPSPAQEKLLVSCGGQDCHVPLRDIGVIRSKRNFCEMKANGQFYRWKEPLKSVAERLRSEKFLPVSRNTLVNLDRITAVDWPERTLTLDTGEKTAFSRSEGKRLGAAGRGKRHEYGSIAAIRFFHAVLCADVPAVHAPGAGEAYAEGTGDIYAGCQCV